MLAAAFVFWNELDWIFFVPNCLMECPISAANANGATP